MTFLLSALLLSPPSKIPYETLDLFLESYGLLRSRYVDPVDEEELLLAAVRGMLSSLDPHSELLDPKALLEFREDRRGRYGGLGLELRLDGEQIRVQRVFPESPAAAAGILRGDRLISIEEQVLAPENFRSLLKSLRGPLGSSVQLKIQRGEAQPISSTLERALIQIKSVRALQLSPSLGLFQLLVLQEGSTLEFRDAYDALREEMELSAMILDLRGCPGGLVSEGVGLADLFLEEGLIVSVRGRQRKRSWSASSPGTLPPLPMIVLIDAETASSAELLAGALQDHGRAQLLGERSYGKASVQLLLPLSKGYALKLSIAHYFRPSGRSLHQRGLQPDFPMERLDKGLSFAEDDPRSDPWLIRAGELLQPTLQARKP